MFGIFVEASRRLAPTVLLALHLSPRLRQLATRLHTHLRQHLKRHRIGEELQSITSAIHDTGAMAGNSL